MPQHDKIGGVFVEVICSLIDKNGGALNVEMRTLLLLIVTPFVSIRAKVDVGK